MSEMIFFCYVIFTSIALAIFVYLFYLRTHRKSREHTPFAFTKSECNPLINPDEASYWQAGGTFNPAAIVDDAGIVHLFYRAIGADGVSRIGYATSVDGIQFERLSTFPIFSFQNDRRLPQGTNERPDPILYPSGGSWGGCEDPRAVLIDGRVYMTFNAFDGWDFIRIGLTSISEKDLHLKKWNWKKTILISPPGEVHKNWVLFPRKINGNFVIIHSISPSVEVEFRKEIETIGSLDPYIESPQGPRVKGREDFWDSVVRGGGPPPVETEKGWLLFYHAVDKHEAHKYKLGVLLLDLENPSKVLARSCLPILEPDAWYENDGKPGIVYACGAVIKDGMLHIYYGGGDRYVCQAQAPVDELLQWLMKHGIESV